MRSARRPALRGAVIVVLAALHLAAVSLPCRPGEGVAAREFATRVLSAAGAIHASHAADPTGASELRAPCPCPCQHAGGGVTASRVGAYLVPATPSPAFLVGTTALSPGATGRASALPDSPDHVPLAT